MPQKIIPTLLVATLFLPMLAGAQQSCPNISNNLELGSTDLATNGEVTTLQGFLKDKGYFNTEPTGTFGSITETAVEKFQTANKIYDSGLVGPITRAKIKKVSGCATPVVNGTVGTSCTCALKLCANGTYAARIGANCSWAVCPTTASNTTSGNTSGSTTGNTTTTGSTSSGGTCTATPAMVDPGPPPATCFNRTVTYYQYDTRRGGFFLNGTTNANYLSPISQGSLAWRPPTSDMGDPDKMIIIRFKTDDAGYMSNVILGFGHDTPVHPFAFISPTPCDYTWAFDSAYNPPGTNNDALLQTTGGAGLWFRVPVLAENQVESFFTSVGTYNGFPMNSSFFGTNKLNKKGYLKPNTYYYFHILSADIYKGGVSSASVGSAIPGVTNNAQLAAASDACGDYIKEQTALNNPQTGINCFGNGSRLDWMNSFDVRWPKRINANGQTEMESNLISGLPAPGSGSSSCVAPAVSGTCGPVNGTSVSRAPYISTDLCTTGTATVIYGWSPFKWTCEGSGGGSSASCSASYSGVN